MESKLVNSGNNSNKGENQSKEAALKKLYRMEWKRNKEDPWHLARSNSTKSEQFEEKKKHLKHEDNYFEGTGVQKNKKTRRPRQTEASPPSMPPRYSALSNPSGPPPVNAWKQKKGSALFSKPVEAEDEEDEMLKLALKESLKTAEEDERKHLERLRLINMESAPPMENKVCAVKKLEDELEEEDEEFEASSSQFGNKSPKNDLHFIDTDTTDEMLVYNQKKKSAPVRTRRLTGLRDKDSAQSVVNIKDAGPHEIPHSVNKFSPVPDDDNYDSFEPSRPIEKRLPSVVNANDFKYKSSSSFVKKSPNHEQKRTIVIPDKDDKLTSSIDNLSSNVELSLTFGDTQDLFENLQEDYVFKSPVVPENVHLESSSYLQNKPTNAQLPMQNCTNATHAYPDSNETDIMLHNFIRHEPPSTVNSNPSLSQQIEASYNTFSPNNLQRLSSSELAQFEQQSLMNSLSCGNIQSVLINTNGQDSSSSMSDSPLQNVTPYGSFENQMSPIGSLQSSQNAQYPLQYPLNLQGNQDIASNLQAMQLASRNFPTQMAYPNGIPPGYITPNHTGRDMVPLASQLTPLPPYRIPTTNVLMPSHTGLEPPNSQLYQAQLQQLMAINALQQYHQAQLAALNLPESAKLLQKEHITAVNQPQVIQPQNQSQIIQPSNQRQTIQSPNQPQIILQQQTQPPLMQAQTHPQLSQNQPLLIMPTNQHLLTMQNSQLMSMLGIPPHLIQPQNEQLTPTLEPSACDFQQQINLQNTGDQGVTDKISEEIKQLVQKFRQDLHEVIQHSDADSQIQPPSVHIPQSLVYATHPVAMSMNTLYPSVPLVPQVQQQSMNSDQISPTTQQGYMNMSGLLASVPELNTCQVPVGKGRGRLQ